MYSSVKYFLLNQHYLASAQYISKTSIILKSNLCEKCFYLKYSTIPPETTHYEILEVKNNCSAKEIKTAFIKLSKQYHPDRNPTDPLLHEKFVKLNEAYSVLNDKHSRHDYDLLLKYKKYANVAASSRSEEPQDGRYQETYKTSQTRYYDVREEMEKNESIPIPKLLVKLSELSKAALVTVLIVVSMGVFGFKVGILNMSSARIRDRLTERDMAIAKHLDEQKQEVMNCTPEENLQRFAERVNNNAYSR